MDNPGSEFVFEAKVTIAEQLVIGNSKYGKRTVVPITGGSFAGPSLRGEVVPGGADWQLVRPDGDLEVDARYTLRADDGTLIHVRNRGLVHLSADAADPEPLYIRTVPEFEAPNEGKYAWLNHAVFIATLQLGDGTFVVVRVFRIAG